MKNKIITLAVLAEARIDENRVPFSPTQISYLLNKFSNLKIIVQPSKRRCFKDKDYLKAGAQITDNLYSSNIIFGVKEVDISTLVKDKIYLFFSHTSKVHQHIGQVIKDKAIIYKKELLKEVIKKNITLIDYENIRNASGEGYRYLGFGRFAGIIGAYNTLNLYLKLNEKLQLPRAFEINNYEQVKKLISKQNFNKLKILLTGSGRASKGAIELLKHANIRQVSINDYLSNKYDEAVFCNISAKKHIERKDGKNSSYQDFILNPHEYNFKVKNYLFDTDIFIACHYWDPKFPKLFYPKQINEFKNLKIIGDVTCDINGSVPTTIRSTSISEPYYSINTDQMKEIELGNKGIAVMAVDNLPSELPRDASVEFGSSVISEILPYLIDKDDGRINRATTASNGKFCENFTYLNDFIN
jgi:saccharopine dehydrogenase (NAD+, L-lysine-forming)